MSSSANVDLEVDQGADFGVQLYWTSTDAVPFRVVSPMRMEVRNAVGSAVLSIAANIDSGKISSRTSSLSYNTESGLVQINLASTDTAKMPAGDYDYDLFVTYTDDVVTGTTRIARLIYGKVHVFGRVTKNV